MARPTALSPEIEKTIITALAIGAYANVAAAAAGIGEKTFYRWMDRGKRALELAEDDQPIPEAEQPYADFAEKVTRASADAELALLADVRQRVANWQASMTILERRAPARWGRRHIVEGPGGGPVLFRRISDDKMGQLTEAQLRAISEGRPIPDDGAPIHPADAGGSGESPRDPSGSNGAGPPH